MIVHRMKKYFFLSTRNTQKFKLNNDYVRSFLQENIKLVLKNSQTLDL